MSSVCDRQFEIYKLHTELAERVASLREDLNKIYSGMAAGVVAAAILVHRLTSTVVSQGTATVQQQVQKDVAVFDWMCAFAGLGIVLSLSWVLSILSVTSRLAAKHRALKNLECQLKIDFLEQEAKQFARGFSIRRQLSALAMPVIFLASCVIWLVWLICVA